MSDEPRKLHPLHEESGWAKDFKRGYSEGWEKHEEPELIPEREDWIRPQEFHDRQLSLNGQVIEDWRQKLEERDHAIQSYSKRLNVLAQEVRERDAIIAGYPAFWQIRAFYFGMAACAVLMGTLWAILNLAGGR